MTRTISFRFLASLLILATVSGGCVLGPDYARPKVQVPANFRFANGEASSVASVVWWQQFGDPVLNELIATALANNQDVKIAAARVEAFRGQFVSTRSQLFPQIGAGLDAGRQRSLLSGSAAAAAGLPSVFDSYSATLPVSWEIDLFGRTRRETEAARADWLASEAGRRATVLSIVASVASSYVNLRSLDRQLEIAKATTASRAASVKVFAARFEGGQTSQMELAQNQSQYESSLGTVAALEKAIAQQEDALSVLLGRAPGPIERGRDIASLEAPVLPAGLPSDLLERRPDVVEAEQDLVAANAMIGAARALYFPQISLTGLFGTSSDQFSKLFTGPARTWAFAGAVTQPIFTAGNIAGQIHQAEAKQQEALYSYQKTIQTAFQEVDDSLIALQKSREKADAQVRQVDALATYARLARLRYDGGYSSYIEVLDAERSLFNAQLEYTQTRADVLASLVTLYKAMGGGWATAAADQTSATNATRPQ